MARRWALWLGIAAALAGAQAAASVMSLQWVRTQFLQGAWWQLLSAQLVHLGWMHALYNGLAMALLLSALLPWLGARSVAVAALGGVLGVAGVLVLDADCATYAGASGALHGLWTGAAVALLGGAARHTVRTGRTGRWVGVAMLVGLALKLLAQRFALDAPDSVLAAVPLYLPAHEAGALGGFVLVALVMGVAALRAAQAQRGQPQP